MGDSEFPKETQQFSQDQGVNPYFQAGDKIEIRIGQRGGVAAEIRMGGELKTNAAVDELIERIDYAIKKLKEKYPEIKIKEQDEKH